MASGEPESRLAALTSSREGSQHPSPPAAETQRPVPREGQQRLRAQARLPPPGMSPNQTPGKAGAQRQRDPTQERRSEPLGTQRPSLSVGGRLPAGSRGLQAGACLLSELRPAVFTVLLPTWKASMVNTKVYLGPFFFFLF